jgi:tRNA (guanine37-N1)-methyltransferase
MTRLLRESLTGVLPSEEMAAIDSGIDVIGDIAILRLSEPLKDRGSAIGEALLRELKNVKVVLDQEGAIGGAYRLRKLRHLAGEIRTLTIQKENDCRFKVDVETCYFSPRLSTERLRIADAVKDGERVLNMFAGVGPFSITIGRKKKKKRDAIEIVSNELNKNAYDLHLENNRLNRVDDKIDTLNDDAAKLPSLLEGKFDRIIMPHPSDSMSYLKAAHELLREEGGWIHCYRHLSAQSVNEATVMLRREIDTLITDEHQTGFRRVRVVGPRLIEMVADIRVRDAQNGSC